MQQLLHENGLTREIPKGSFASVNPRTERLVYLAMWTTSPLFRPTLHSMQQSFEDWARVNGLGRRLAELERKNRPESTGTDGLSSLVRELARNGPAAMNGRGNPAARWRRKWDGHWRIVMFDVPASRKALRWRLWRFLRANGFGYLQNSVWITPDPMEALRSRLRAHAVEVETLTFMEARPCGGETDRELVAGAWAFGSINENYRKHGAILRSCPAGKGQAPCAPRVWRHWVEMERVAWATAVKADPMLPTVLLPKGYLGRQAWQARERMLRLGSEG